MAKHRIPIRIAICPVDDCAAHERPGKARQRAAAARCMAALDAGLSPRAGLTTSVSHSRGWAAVAGVVGAKDMRVGLDIEYIDASRNWRGVLGALAPSAALNLPPTASALIWTFYEAHYKATGDFPDEAEIMRMAAALEARPFTDVGVAHLCRDVLHHVTHMPGDVQFAASVAVFPADNATALDIEWLNLRRGATTAHVRKGI